MITTPQGRVVINSILPRDGLNGDLRDNWEWDLVNQANAQVACWAETEPKVEFFNATDYFLSSEYTRNLTLYLDTVHPSEDGYRIWGRAIAERVYAILGRESYVASVNRASKPCLSVRAQKLFFGRFQYEEVCTTFSAL